MLVTFKKTTLGYIPSNFKGLDAFDILICSNGDYDIFPTEDLQYRFDVGVDLYNSERFDIVSDEIVFVPTGVKIAIREDLGLYFRVVPRSSTCKTFKVTMPNSEGIIDPTYRGEIMIPLMKIVSDRITCEAGYRLVQMILAPYIPIGFHAEMPQKETLNIGYYNSKSIFEKWDELIPSIRGANGFGSTGKTRHTKKNK